MHPTQPLSPEMTSTAYDPPSYDVPSSSSSSARPARSDSPAPCTPDTDGLAPLPSTLLTSSLDALKRTPTARSTGGTVPASKDGGLTRITTVELQGKVYMTRRGRGEEIGEPLRDAVTREEITYIEWPEGDPENPFNYSQRRKWIYTIICVSMTALTSANATAYSSGFASAGEILGVSKFEWTVGNAVFLLVIAFVPLVLAPLSEVYGRHGIYLVTSFLSAALFIPQALSPSMAGIIASRAFQGASSSVGNSLVGGTIADLFQADERGLGMSIYSLWVFAGQAIGPCMYGWICQLVDYKMMFWVQAALGFVSFLCNLFFLRETRGGVLLSRRAVALTKATGKLHSAPGDKERSDLKTLISVSCTRPILYLATEPIVFAVSLWIGVCWACIFVFLNSVSIVFGEAYGMGTGQTGTILLSIGVGGLIGFFLNLVQERLYSRAARKSPTGKAEPEARLYFAIIGAFAFPLGIFWYAWTGRVGIHWIWPTLALTLVNAGVFLIYSAVFSYFSDAYERYSSSAQAAQSLLRNIFAGTFPLFSTVMYHRMGAPYASTLLGCITLLLGFCPAVLLVFGRRLRARSKVASALLREQEEEDEKRAEVRGRAKDEAELRRRKVGIDGEEKLAV